MTEKTVRFVRLGKVTDIPEGRPETFEIEDRHIAVYRLDDGYYAIEDTCTHDGGPLAEGTIEGEVIECPRHGARFDIRSGAVLSMPATSPVTTYPVRVAGGEIQVDLS